MNIKDFTKLLKTSSKHIYFFLSQPSKSKKLQVNATNQILGEWSCRQNWYKINK